jgi:hypothetical protein
MNVLKIAQEIIAADIVDRVVDKEKVVREKTKTKKPVKKVIKDPTPEPSKPRPETSIPQIQIDAAMELAGLLREKVSSLLSELDLALNDLSGESSPSILDSKDDFKSLVLRLKAMKRKLMVV